RASAAAKPHIGGQPSWHGVMVAVSDDADWKTKNKLAIAGPGELPSFFLHLNYSLKSQCVLVRLGSGRSRSLPVLAAHGMLLVDHSATGIRFGCPGFSPGRRLCFCDHSDSDHLFDLGYRRNSA